MSGARAWGGEAGGGERRELEGRGESERRRDEFRSTRRRLWRRGGGDYGRRRSGWCGRGARHVAEEGY